MRIDPSNVEQLRAWDGADGEFWAARARRLDEGVAAYQGHLLAAAGIERADRVLDVGCGSGQTTRDAARRAGAGSALGVDLSARMIDLARRLAADEQLANLSFEQADAQLHPFPQGQFDLVVSRSGAMFFGDPPTAFGNLARALRPGGRLALMAWQPLAHNEWLSSFRAALDAGRDLAPPPPVGPGPFGLSEPDRVRALLTSAGFTEVRITGLSEQMYFGRDTEDAFGFVSGQFGWMVRDLDPPHRDRALDTLRAVLAEHRTDRGVLFDSATWIIQART
ncbi:class I SAM-dependent methyltransferase [Kutzneria albida]|uniref:Methyltransferase domain-containing protein n=1 Tax=Kutzneria albida DSM 43870 TaxID=1449976 RepID=W5WA42_9PSEU|nr:class I SAM-dependent methyltransferase [Kutzneria albida]AHH98003.1 hypothetical protein KALB_4641 [Kutzneria albida DSM 43870]